MNAKKCKQIRKLLRVQGTDWRESSHTTPEPVAVFKDRFDEKLLRVVREVLYFKTDTVTLTDCGSKTYSFIKRAAQRLNIQRSSIRSAAV